MRVIKLLIFTALVMIFNLTCSKSNNDDTLKSSTNTLPIAQSGNVKTSSEKGLECKGIPSDPYPRYPFTDVYFDGFMNSSVSFSQFYIEYLMSDDVEHPNARQLFFNIQSPTDENDNTELLINKTLSEISNYYVTYEVLTNPREYYHATLPSNLIMPIYNIIHGQSMYYFNAEEYGGAESKTVGVENQFGHLNFITMTIEEPQQEPYVIPPCKTFCKGWDPGDSPPSELMPLINYIENTIFPYMRGQGVP